MEFDTKSIIIRISNLIENAWLEYNPTPHFYISDIFPNNLYDYLLNLLPLDSDLAPINHRDAINSNGNITRYLLDLTPHTISIFDKERKLFWSKLIQILTSEEIINTLLNKFSIQISKRFGDALPEYEVVPIFYRDFSGYKIGIHPDSENKIATFQFYLPKDFSQKHLGTIFHERDNDKFHEVKKNLFLPNSAYAFVRTDESWHSVDELGLTELPRNSLAITVYVKGYAYSST